MRTLLSAVAVTLIAGSAFAQFKVTQVQTPNAQTATMQAPPATESLDAAKRIPRDEAIKMVSEGKAVWIDVRPVGDYDAGHIKGAINIPLSEISGNFTEAMKKAPPHKYLITYCA